MIDAAAMLGSKDATGAAVAGASFDAEDPAYKSAKAKALRQLAMRDHSRHELEQKLLGKDVSPEMATIVLDRLESAHLIDDVQFAESFVRSRHRSRGLAPRALLQELKAKGIAPEITAEAVAPVDDRQQHETALHLVSRKAASSRGLEREKRVRRLVGMLARKGYPTGLCFSVVREVLDADGA
jgi:regulatory protein